MPLTIDDPEAARLARELARRQGTGTTEAVVHALRRELDREKERAADAERTAMRQGLAERLLEIGAEYRRLPTLDSRTPDEILGYHDWGLPS